MPAENEIDLQARHPADPDILLDDFDMVLQARDGQRVALADDVILSR